METPILVYSSGDPFGNHLQHSAYDQLIEGNEFEEHTHEESRRRNFTFY